MKWQDIVLHRNNDKKSMLLVNILTELEQKGKITAHIEDNQIVFSCVD